MIYLRKYRKRSQSDKNTIGSVDSPQETQPYLQPELDAEGKRILELDAVEKRYEMSGEDGLHEMSEEDARKEMDTISRPGMPSLRAKHELKGQERSKGLEAP